MLYPHKKNPGTAGKRATLISILACVSAAVTFAAPVHAATQDEVRTKIVRYGDLNLASAEGREALDQRIRRAAKQVCAVSGMYPILQRRKIRACAEEAHSQAWAIAQQRIGSYRLAVRASN